MMCLVSPKKAIAFLPLVLLACGFCQKASATTLFVSLDNQGRYLNPLNFVDKDGATSGYAGVFLASLDGGAALPVFCVDIYTQISPGIAYNVNVIAPNSPAAAAYSLRLPQAAWLYVTYLPQVNAAANKAVTGAALQLAIWDIIHDGGDGLTNGTVQLNPGIADATNIAATTLASTMIAAAQGHSLLNAAILMNVAGPSGSQTLITAASAMDQAAPEPSTLALLGLGLVAGILKRRSSFGASKRHS